MFASKGLARGLNKANKSGQVSELRKKSTDLFKLFERDTDLLEGCHRLVEGGLVKRMMTGFKSKPIPPGVRKFRDLRDGLKRTVVTKANRIEFPKDEMRAIKDDSNPEEEQTLSNLFEAATGWKKGDSVVQRDEESLLEMADARIHVYGKVMSRVTYNSRTGVVMTQCVFGLVNDEMKYDGVASDSLTQLIFWRSEQMVNVFCAYSLCTAVACVVCRCVWRGDAWCVYVSECVAWLVVCV